MSDFWFVTFGDSRLVASHRRIRSQADALGIFGNRARIFSENDLDEDFREKMKDHLVPGSRGFGYWCWKPQVILQVFREMKDGDVLLYADIGCHLRKQGIARLMEYFELAGKYGIVAFQSRALGEEARNNLALHFLPERQWTKMDLLKHFGVESDKNILETGQIGAGIIVLKKNVAVVKIMDDWLSMFENHFNLCDDSPSICFNFPEFRENHHDQSVFSLLCKINNVYTLSSAEYVTIDEYMPIGANPSLWPAKWSDIANCPVWAKRDLGKYTKIVACPDWLKPILGKRGRKFCSRMYDTLKPIVDIVKGC